MDVTKQPGISFDGIILVKESFWRDVNVPDSSKVELNVDMKLNITEGVSTNQLATTLLMKNDGHDVLKLETTFVGLFSVNPSEKNMNMEKYLQTNSAALMFPFVREHIAIISQKAGVGPILLPPINIIAVINQGKKQPS